MRGFLGTGATFFADLNLLIQLAMGVALLFGWRLARRRQYKAHGLCQSAVLLLNLVMIVVVMLPAFGRQVQPTLPGGLGESYYAVATAHAVLGGAAELLGLYILLVAGTRLLPERVRMKRWRVWMRTELALWWVVLLIGLGTYAVWYLAPESQARVPQAASGPVTVRISNFDFAPREVTVRVGATVEWVNESGRHTVVGDDGSFQSEMLRTGDKFARRFDQPGTYPYYCGFHGDKGGKDMAGAVRVIR